MGFLRAAAVHLSHLLPSQARRDLKWTLMIPDAGASLQLLHRKGFRPRAVIDIGAYVGEWTTMVKQIWPDAAVMMVEAQPSKKAVLDRIIAAHQNVELRNTLLSDEAGKEYEFNVDETGSSIYCSLDSTSGKTVRLTSQRLADVVAGTRFEKPDFVKLDVQGAELAVMRGGLDVIQGAEVVMLETSLIEEYAGQPLFSDVQKFMDDLGFAVHDICTIWRNTPSGSVNEFDVIFVRRDSDLFEPRHYRYSAQR